MPPRGGHLGPGFLTDEEKENKPKVTKELIRRIFSHLAPYKLRLAAVILCLLVSSVLSLLPSVLTGKMIDEGLIGQDMSALIFYIVLSLAVTRLALVSSLIPVVPAGKYEASPVSVGRKIAEYSVYAAKAS